ncbi:MAG: stage II sporulation protein M [Saprospiraceae bacterium]|nr:stage II sporulation protein M [Saprospiraceae bacterium]
MRETKFIEQNREKWSEFEEMLRENHKDPEKLNDLFIQITDDLSYARTFYPNRSVRMYLNSMAQRIFHNVYRGKRFPAKRFWQFWTKELPQLMWESRQALLLSFCVFTLACLVGVVSSMIDPDFARVALGDGYVDMTLNNIEHGDPMAVYKENQPLGMSVGIAANNLFVALRTAIFGVLASIGTVFLLLYNGVILGAFQYFFIEKGLFWDSFLTIWIHGTLEISAIVIAGAAGLVAGSGLLFPGTYTRVQAFQLSMRRGLKIFIGLIPMFLLAAFFEGFLTRYTETPAVIRFLFILSSLAFVLWYFVWYPWHQARAGFAEPLQEKELPPLRDQPIQFGVIKDAGESFSDIFSIVLRHPRLNWLGLAVVSALSVGLMGWSAGEDYKSAFSFSRELTGAFGGWWSGLSNMKGAAFIGGQILLFWVVAVAALRSVRQEMPEAMRSQWARPFLGWHQLIALLVAGLMHLFVQNIALGGFLWLIGMVLFPLLGLWVAAAQLERASWRALPRSFALIRWGQSLLLGFLIINFALLLFLFLDSPVWEMLMQFFSWLIPPDEGNMHLYSMYTTAFMVSFVAHFTWLMLVLGGAMQYFSGREITDAAQLREDIEKIGALRQIRGLARE